MKRRLAATLLAVTAGLGLAACGSGGQKPAAATQAAAPANFCDALKATDGQHSDVQRQELLDHAYALAPTDIATQMLVLAQYAGTQIRDLDTSQMEDLATATQVVRSWRVANCAD